MMPAFERDGDKEGQSTKASERSFSGLNITSMSRLRTSSWLLTHGTNWKQINLTALDSWRALNCQINKYSLKSPITAHRPKKLQLPQSSTNKNEAVKVVRPWGRSPSPVPPSHTSWRIVGKKEGGEKLSRHTTNCNHCKKSLHFRIAEADCINSKCWGL